MKRFISICLCLVLAAGVIGYVPSVNGAWFFADGYNGSTYEGSSTEIIRYGTKTDIENSMKGALPKYHDSGTNDNACANVAGSIILGFYDKDYDELIPNFKAARVIRDKIIFATQTQAVQDVIDDLHIRMKTNETGKGTTVEDFKTGLRSYVDQQGRDITYNPLVSKEQLDINGYKNSVNNKKPIVLFVSKYTMIDLNSIQESNQTDTYTLLHYGGNHVLVGYGIREIVYYNSNGSLQEKVTLLTVATGYYQDPLAYVVLDDTMRIIDVYEVEIY